MEFKPGSRRERIYNVLKENGGEMLSTDIAPLVGCTAKEVRTSIRELVKKGLVKRRATFGIVEAEDVFGVRRHTQKMIAFSLTEE